MDRHNLTVSMRPPHTYRHPLVCLLIFGISCGPFSDERAVGQIRGQTLTLKGSIDARMIEDLKKVNWSSVDKIVVTSYGGDAKGAIFVARYLKSVNKPIIIEDYCVSACFNILIINRGVTVRPGTLVAMHHTLLSLSRITTRAYPKISEFYSHEAEEEELWYRQNGVDESILITPQKVMNTQCVFGPKRDDPRQYQDIAYRSQFELWVPPKKVLKAAGVQASGGWIEKTTDVNSQFLSRHPNADVGRLTFSLPDEEWNSATLARKEQTLVVPHC